MFSGHNYTGCAVSTENDKKLKVFSTIRQADLTEAFTAATADFNIGDHLIYSHRDKLNLILNFKFLILLVF